MHNASLVHSSIHSKAASLQTLYIIRNHALLSYDALIMYVCLLILRCTITCAWRKGLRFASAFVRGGQTKTRLFVVRVLSRRNGKVTESYAHVHSAWRGARGEEGRKSPSLFTICDNASSSASFICGSLMSHRRGTWLCSREVHTIMAPRTIGISTIKKN